MAVVYRDLTIDCSKDNFKSEKVTGYEHGVKVFRFKPLNGNIPIDLSDCTGAAYVGTKSDGKIIGNACEIKDNKILLPLSLQMTTARGDLKGHIEVYFPTGTLKFFGVDFEVYPSPETAEIESKDEFTLLESKIAEVNKIIAEGIETSQGKSAYEIAVENGFDGTVDEWLESLRGKNGNDYILTDNDKRNIIEEITKSIGVTDKKAELINIVQITDAVSMIELGNSDIDFSIYKEIYIFNKIVGDLNNTATSNLIIYKNDDITDIKNKFADFYNGDFKFSLPKTATLDCTLSIVIDENKKQYKVTYSTNKTSGYQCMMEGQGVFYQTEGYTSIIRDYMIFPHRLIFTSANPTTWYFGAGTKFEIYGVKK